MVRLSSCGLAGRVLWKQFLSELSLVLICLKVVMVTANHILGQLLSAFVAMGIAVFCSFVFCEKREVLLLPLAYPLKRAEDGGELWSATLLLEQNICAGVGL